MPLFCNPSTKILLVCYNISVKTLFGSSYLHLLCRRFMFHVFYTYVYWRPIIFPFQIRLVSLNTSGAETVCRFGVPEFILGLCFFVFGSYCSVLSFLCNVLRIIVCRMYLLPMILSAIRLVASDSHCGISRFCSCLWFFYFFYKIHVV